MFKFSSNSSPIFQSIPALPEHKEFLQPNQNSIVNYDEKSRTLDPTTTGTSVLGIKCRDFVMIASDTCVSYGSLARYRSIHRMKNVGEYTLIGATGEYSDFQFVMDLLNQLMTQDKLHDDASVLYPKEIFNYLTRVMYNRRNNFNPYYNQFVLSGFRNGTSFMGYVDLVGTSYQDDTLATGYGAYIARPLLRKAWRPDLTKKEAQKILEDSMRVLFYRDARSLNRIQIGTVSQEGWTISEPFSLETNWEYAASIQGYE